jgi:hypothetical protein
VIEMDKEIKKVEPEIKKVEPEIKKVPDTSEEKPLNIGQVKKLLRL